MEQGSANTTATAEEELEPKPEPMDQSSAALEPKIEPDAAPTADDNKAELGETWSELTAVSLNGLLLSARFRSDAAASGDAKTLDAKLSLVKKENQWFDVGIIKATSCVVSHYHLPSEAQQLNGEAKVAFSS